MIEGSIPHKSVKLPEIKSFSGIRNKVPISSDGTRMRYMLPWLPPKVPPGVL